MAASSRTITDVADDVIGKAKPRVRKAKAEAEELIVEAKDEIVEVAGKVGSGAKTAAASGKDMAADAMHGLADAARQMADKLDDGKPDSGNAKAANFARKAADSMDRFSTRLKEKDLDEIASDARAAVRENPAIAVGAAALIGFALARFLKGSGGRDS